MKVSRLWKHYKKSFAPYQKYQVGVLVLYGIGALASFALMPLLYKELIDTLTLHNDSRMEIAKYAFILIAIIGCNSLFFNILYRVGDIWLVQSQSNITRGLQNYCLEHITQQSYGFFSDRFTGSLVTKTKRFIGSFETLNDLVIFNFWMNGLQLVSVVVVMAYFSPLLGGIFFLWIICFAALSKWIIKKKIPLDLARARDESITTGRYADVLTNILNVKMFATSHMEIMTYMNVTKQEETSRTKAWDFDNTIRFVQAIFVMVFEIGIVFTAVYLWLYGHISLGVVMLVYVYLLNTFNIVWGLGRQITKFFQAITDAEEMVEILELEHSVANADKPQESQMEQGEISFSNVQFGYENNPAVFEDFNLDISSGEKVAFVGHSGAGKTTITKLLLRFTDIQSGSITVDGQNIAHITQDDLRRNIAYVPQDPILFHRTLRENIAYGKENATEEEIVQASIDAHAHEFITKLPDGYDTLVGERGVKLSGGERQRVAIARAMLKDAPILVLDEATSALDSITEQKIQDAFKKLSENRTTLVIAHRLSTIVTMDRIVVMENGAIAEQGTHQELLGHKGIYAELWQSQSHGFIGE